MCHNFSIWLFPLLRRNVVFFLRTIQSQDPIHKSNHTCSVDFGTHSNLAAGDCGQLVYIAFSASAVYREPTTEEYKKLLDWL